MAFEVGDLVALMFRFVYGFAVPNVLYCEELQDQHSHLLDMGLQVRTLTDKGVGRTGYPTRNCQGVMYWPLIRCTLISPTSLGSLSNFLCTALTRSHCA